MFSLTAAGLALALSLTPATTNETGRQDIVDTAVAAGSFETLATALTKAGLVDALKGEGPFTVFAPTDEAFAALPEGTVESLLKPENIGTLQAILLYHVVPGEMPASKVVKASGAETLNGQRIDFAADKDGVRVDTANVVKTDIRCTNGVIHVIDSVILPSQDDLVATASAAGAFNTLLAAATAAGLVDTLTGEGPLTVLAPTDEAFRKLPAGTVESLLKPENKDQLVAILTYHVLPGRVYSGEALRTKTFTTVQSSDVTFATRGEKAYVEGAQIVSADIDASNGVIHVIDSVILPPKRTAAAGAGERQGSGD